MTKTKVKTKRGPGRPKGTSGGDARELSVAEISRLMKVASEGRWGARNRALIALCLGSGVRISEAVGLTIGNVCDERRVKTAFNLNRTKTKNKESRSVHLTKQCQDELQSYIDGLEDASPKQPLFRSQKGDALAPNGAVKLLSVLMKRAKFKDASSHSLRRTFAVTLRRRGTDLMVISKLLGHASLSVTARYLSATEAERQAAVEDVRF